MTSLRTFVILSILLVDVSAQLFKCFSKCDADWHYLKDKAECMLKCPKKEIEECKNRCRAKSWPIDGVCLAGIPLTCLAFL
ncbi:unnamed protein product [Cylicocyclus nassatus]|uniref:Uncharacterized protein n=1 Tax=Cylicocyclus nassatus TaxID=53992 RepID=A0AA36GWD7_CYLNA|nr:unnamed protein product [Cylicocyclus nassatus]